MMARHALRLYRRLILRLYYGCIPQIDGVRGVRLLSPSKLAYRTRPAGEPTRQSMRSALLTLSCLFSSSRVCAAAPASLIADLPDVGDEGEDEEFLPIGDGPGGGGGYVYEGEGMEYGMWDEGMDEGYYGEPEDVEELLRDLFRCTAWPCQP